MTRTLTLFVAAKGERLDLKKVRAEIELPEHGEGWIRVRLYPQLSVPTTFHMPFEWTLSGDISDLGGQIVTHVESPRVWTQGVSHVTWDRNTTDTTVKACADEMRVTSIFRSESPASARRALVFMLSPGPALNSARLVTYRETGAVGIRTVHRTALVLSGRERLTFETQAKWEGEETKTARSVLVGKIRSTRTADELLPEIEDVLALASAAMRHRVVCTGWVQSGKDELLECVRGNVHSPRQEPWDENNALIPREHVAAFLARASTRLRRSAQTSLLRQVLWRVVPHQRESVDQRFTRLFSVLESLILYWSRAKKREFILPKGQFRPVRRALLAVLARNVRATAKRVAVERKLGELNRPALADSFARACRDARAEVGDLWPFDNQDGIGLAWIRNKFSHGEYVPYHVGLEIAGDHLQWVVERLLLAALGWPVEKSQVSMRSLQLLVSYEAWREERKSFMKAVDREFPRGAADA